jgi:hypothetical protein
MAARTERAVSKPSKKQQKSAWRDVDGGYAFVVPYTLLRHDNWRRMSPYACKLVIDLGRQYSGFNNGHLCAAWELMRQEGWRSRETLFFAIAEAEHYRVIVKTRQGGRNRPNLYGLTWWRIHAGKDEASDVVPTLSPSNAWKEARPVFIRTEIAANELHARRAA